MNDDQPATSVSPPNATYAPPAALIGSSMFYDAAGDCNIYGGTLSSGNVTEDRLIGASSTPGTLWTWSDNEDTWRSLNLGNIGPMNTPVNASYAQAPEHDLVFLFNGVFSNGLGGMAYPKMRVVNTGTQDVRIVDTASVSQSAARVGGVLQYLPMLGTRGALVLFGGATRYSDTTTDPLGNMVMHPHVVCGLLLICGNQGSIGYHPRFRYRVPQRHDRRNLVSAAYRWSDSTTTHVHLRHIDHVTR